MASYYEESRFLATARDNLDLESRRELISAIPEDANPVFFRYLVGDDPDLYDVLLRRRSARAAHLAPLRRATSEAREALVREAVKHGYSRRDADDRRLRATSKGWRQDRPSA